jgi:hypothetical protein
VLGCGSSERCCAVGEGVVSVTRLRSSRVAPSGQVIGVCVLLIFCYCFVGSGAGEFLVRLRSWLVMHS